MGIPHLPYMNISATGDDAEVVGGWLPLIYDNISRCSFHLEYGAVTGTWTVEVSNDPRCFPGHPDAANADFDDITTDVAPTNPSGSGSDEIVTIDNANYSFIRWKYDNSAGTGTVKVYFTGVSA